MVFKDIIESTLFFGLTLLFYFLFAMTLPILEGSHGLLVMADLPSILQGEIFKTLLFLSAGACSLMGALLLSWVPAFSPSVMGSLWAATFFLIWADAVFQLSQQAQSYRYLVAFVIGLVFIYFFFFILERIVSRVPGTGKESKWKMEIVQYWFLGWIGFYAGLSGLLALRSFRSDGFHMPLALGSMVVCFLNYLLYLYLKRDSGKKVEVASRIGRWAFTLWILTLGAIWIGTQWFD